MKRVAIEDLIVLTEDYALSLNTSLYLLIEDKQKEGFRIVAKYHHPAVGEVVQLKRDYSLAG